MFTLGTDPEFILTNQGVPTSAIGVLPRKKNKKQINGTYFYYDNVLAEFGLKPSETKEEFVENIRLALFNLKSLVNPLKITTLASTHYSFRELRHKDARKVGCKAEWCVYTLKAIMPPKVTIEKTGFRSAGGHIHFGIKSGPLTDMFESLYLIRMLDLFLGIPLTLIGKEKSAKERKKIYGKAGRHRIPRHGVEYRMPDNYWLSKPKLIELIWDLCEFTYKFCEEKRYKNFWSEEKELIRTRNPSKGYKCFGYDSLKLRNIINKNNKEEAKDFLPLLKDLIPEKLFKLIYTNF